MICGRKKNMNEYLNVYVYVEGTIWIFYSKCIDFKEVAMKLDYTASDE